MLESVVGQEDKRSDAMKELVNRKGILESNEDSIMHREFDFGWVVARAKVVTNSVAVRDNINKKIAGRHWMKTLDNKWMIDVVTQGFHQE